MARIYAVREDNGARVLVLIKCDGPCNPEAAIKPQPRIAESGWTQRGHDNGIGTEKTYRDYCPACSPVYNGWFQ